MSNYNELTTINDLRVNYLGISATTDDALLTTFIKTSSDWITKAARRSFVPRIETRYFNAEKDIDGSNLVLDSDLLDPLTVTNGDSVVVAPGERTVIPKNRTPYDYIRLLTSSSKMWTYSTNPEDAITVNGVWGYHENYANAWEQIDTLAANTTSSATSLTLTTGAGYAGEIWKIETELMYLSARNATTATVVRAINGSTGATHASTTAIYRWIPDVGIQHVCKLASYALLKLRDNPESERIVVDGIEFFGLKDVEKQIVSQIKALNLVRQ